MFPARGASGLPEEDQSIADLTTAVDSTAAIDPSALAMGEEAARLLSSGDEVNPDPSEWVTQLSRINIVRNQHFGQAWESYLDNPINFESIICKHSLRGNSRE